MSLNGLPIVNIGKLLPMATRGRTAFGLRMYEARKRAKMTQEKAAEVVGIAQSTLSELETVANGSTYTVKLAAVYGCSAAWLSDGIGSIDDRAPAPPPQLAPWPLQWISRDEWEALTPQEQGAIGWAAASALQTIRQKAGPPKVQPEAAAPATATPREDLADEIGQALAKHGRRRADRKPPEGSGSDS